MASARFDQHRGIAPILWVFASLALLELLVVHLVMASRWPSLAWLLTVVTGAMGVLAIYKHKGNIQRLMSGTEPRFGRKKPEEAAQ